MVAKSALRVVVVATDGDCRAVGEADAQDENSTTGMVPRCSFACGSSITASIRTPSLTDWTSILRVELVAIGTFANLKGGEKASGVSNNQLGCPGSWMIRKHIRESVPAKRVEG